MQRTARPFGFAFPVELAGNRDGVGIHLEHPLANLGSTSSIRRKYFFVSDAALSFPDFIAACRLATVASSHSNGLTRAGIGMGGEAAGDSPRADAIASA